MQVFFIEQALKKSSFKAFFKTIQLDEDKIILNVDCTKMNINKKIKLVKNIKKILQKNNVDTVIIEQNLKKDKEFMNLIYSNDIKIIERKISL